MKGNFMKKTGIFALFTLIISSLVFGDYLEKLYIDLDKVIFDQSGIFLERNGIFFEIEGILFDKLEKKYYTFLKEAKWQCGNCGKYNDPKRNNCWYCGWPWGPPGPYDEAP